MPYKDPNKQREAVRKSVRKYNERKRKKLGIKPIPGQQYTEGPKKGQWLPGNNIKEIPYDHKKTQRVLKKFLSKVSSKDIIPSIVLFLEMYGINKEVWYKWKDRGFAGVAEAHKKIEALQEIYLLNKGINARNPAFSIFLLKANHGYQETSKQEIEQTVNHKFEIVDYSKVELPNSNVKDVDAIEK